MDVSACVCVCVCRCVFWFCCCLTRVSSGRARVCGLSPEYQHVCVCVLREVPLMPLLLGLLVGTMLCCCRQQVFDHCDSAHASALMMSI